MQAMVGRAMTVTPAEVDPEMHGHTAVNLDGTCHAKVSDYSDGERSDATECGIRLSENLTRYDIGAREQFAEDGIQMCRECWPSSIYE